MTLELHSLQLVSSLQVGGTSHLVSGPNRGAVELVPNSCVPPLVHDAMMEVEAAGSQYPRPARHHALRLFFCKDDCSSVVDGNGLRGLGQCPLLLPCHLSHATLVKTLLVQATLVKACKLVQAWVLLRSYSSIHSPSNNSFLVYGLSIVQRRQQVLVVDVHQAQHLRGYAHITSACAACVNADLCVLSSGTHALHESTTPS